MGKMRAELATAFYYCYRQAHLLPSSGIMWEEQWVGRHTLTKQGYQCHGGQDLWAKQLHLLDLCLLGTFPLTHLCSRRAMDPGAPLDSVRLFLIQEQTHMWRAVPSEDLQESEVCCSVEFRPQCVRFNDSWQGVLVFMFITRPWFYNRAKLENRNAQVSETTEGNLKLPRTECYQHANCVASETSVALIYLYDLGKWCHVSDPQGSHD